ncbi:hypothetical protein [Serratia sp. D1N4]
MMKIRFLWSALLGATLLCGSIQSAMAGTYYVFQMTNCYMTGLGNNQWKVSFNWESKSLSSPNNPNGVTNYFIVKIPKISADGTTVDRTATGFMNPIPALDFTFSQPGGFYARPPSGDQVVVGNPNGTLLITTNGNVSFTFSTNGNGAYPAARVFPNFSTTDASAGNGWYWFIPTVTNGTCGTYGGGEKPPSVVPPVEELMPVDPDFKMTSAVWELNTLDVGDLPDVSAAGTGYPASIKNAASNQLCVNYVTAGIKNKTYALSVSNSASTQNGRSLFTLQGPGSQLFYNLQLTSNDGVTGNNFNFPTATAKYINLSQTASSTANRSEMCWTPQVNLFKNASTTAGLHSDNVAFVITPKA